MTAMQFDSPAVQTYVEILQGVISRLASNSASCKTWCVTLVSAILVVVADKDHGSYVFIALVPVVVFVLLDAYYLALERLFRERFNAFVTKVQDGEAVVDDLFVLSSYRGTPTIFWYSAAALASFSIWPFYGALVLMIEVTRRVVL